MIIINKLRSLNKHGRIVPIKAVLFNRSYRSSVVSYKLDPIQFDHSVDIPRGGPRKLVPPVPGIQVPGPHTIRHLQVVHIIHEHEQIPVSRVDVGPGVFRKRAWWRNASIHVMGTEVRLPLVPGVGVGIKDGLVEPGGDVVGVVKQEVMESRLEHVVSVPAGQGGEDAHVEVWVQADKRGVAPGGPSVVHKLITYDNGYYLIL